MMLDKVKSGKGLRNDKKKFKDERDATTDTIIDRIQDIAQEKKDVILRLEEKLKSRASKLKGEVSLNLIFRQRKR